MHEFSNKVINYFSRWNFYELVFVLPCPLLMLFPLVNKIWLSSSSNSDFNSASLLLLFFTMEATSDNERRSVVTSRSFSAPSLIYRKNLSNENCNSKWIKKHFHLQLFPNLTSNRFFDLFQPMRKRTFWQIIGESIFVTQLI